MEWRKEDVDGTEERGSQRSGRGLGVLGLPVRAGACVCIWFQWAFDLRCWRDACYSIHRTASPTETLVYFDCKKYLFFNWILFNYVRDEFLY
jgi:hypothetical protein